jgi:hypothetical protein
VLPVPFSTHLSAPPSTVSAWLAVQTGASRWSSRRSRRCNRGWHLHRGAGHPGSQEIPSRPLGMTAPVVVPPSHADSKTKNGTAKLLVASRLRISPPTKIRQITFLRFGQSRQAHRTSLRNDPERNRHLLRNCISRPAQMLRRADGMGYCLRMQLPRGSRLAARHDRPARSASRDSAARALRPSGPPRVKRVRYSPRSTT